MSFKCSAKIDGSNQLSFSHSQWTTFCILSGYNNHTNSCLCSLLEEGTSDRWNLLLATTRVRVLTHKDLRSPPKAFATDSNTPHSLFQFVNTQEWSSPPPLSSSPYAALLLPSPLLLLLESNLLWSRLLLRLTLSPRVRRSSRRLRMWVRFCAFCNCNRMCWNAVNVLEYSQLIERERLRHGSVRGR